MRRDKSLDLDETDASSVTAKEPLAPYAANAWIESEVTMSNSKMTGRFKPKMKAALIAKRY